MSVLTGSWIPKAFSRPQSDSSAGSAGPSSPLQGRTRFADQPLSTGQMAQPDGWEGQSELGPLPSSKAPQETFTALPSLPVPAPIIGQCKAVSLLCVYTCTRQKCHKQLGFVTLDDCELNFHTILKHSAFELQLFPLAAAAAAAAAAATAAAAIT